MCNSNIKLMTPILGEYKDIIMSSDPVFSSGVMGKGACVVPIEGSVYSPADGKIIMIFPTLHAIGIKLDSGVEVLIHVGINTVSLNGKYFKCYVKEGQLIKSGDKLISFDLEKIKKHGIDPTSMIIITNSSEYNVIKVDEGVKLKQELPCISIQN